MKKVCIVTQHRFSPPHCRTYDKAKILSSNGYDVVTIALGNKNLPKEETLEHTILLRVSDEGIKRPKLPLLNNPVLVYKLYSRALRTKADVYHIIDMDNILVGFFLKTIKGKKVIYDIGDDFPSYNNFPGFVQWIIRSLEGHLLKYYDTIIVLSKSLKKDRIKYTKNIEVIPHTPDPSFNPNNVMSSKKEVDYVLVFEGQIQSKKGIIEILKALSLVLKEIKSVKLLLIGEIRSDEKELILSMIEKYGLKEHIEITGWMKHTDVPKYINLGDLGICIYKPWSYSYVIGVSNKLIDYMACGKPVIGPRNFPEMEKTVNSAKCGILVDHNDPRQIANAAIYLMRNEKIRKKMGINARKHIEKYHLWESFEKKLLAIYDSLWY
ncbi:MAG: glycosyltransferase family 4 protein [Methanomassiliicoccales archaeon]|nr:MAG: glycosyltransferase family 4 protein [Methanomassiliicoccales archaeon]